MKSSESGDGRAARPAEPLEAAGGGAAGAPPSNTAPANCTVLGTGVDSLYVSYSGHLAKSAKATLQTLKELAQSEKPGDRVQAQLLMANHLFEVHPRGKGLFAFVLSDNWYHLQVRGQEKGTVPLAYVQIGSELLARTGVEEVIGKLRPVINTLGVDPAGPSISRADLYVDLATDADLGRLPLTAYVCRAKKRNQYYDGRRLSGVTIGQGGKLMARLYDKTLEIKVSGKSWLRDVWKARGWDGRTPVWRAEFQLRRETLSEFGATGVDTFLHLRPAIWAYCTEEWLRLTVPSVGDYTSARWPTHPLWQVVQSENTALGAVEPAERVRKTREPEDAALFLNGLGGLTSFMAREGITDLGEGFGEYLQAAEAFHGGSRVGLARYVDGKVQEKGRRFNTIKTGGSSRKERHARDEAARAYRAGKDGE